MQTYIRFCKKLADRQGFVFEGQITTEMESEFHGFDLVHLTNIDRPVELYSQYNAARRSGKPIVLSPLHHSYEEIRAYEWKGRGGIIGMFSGLVGFERLELLRSFVRSRQYPQLQAPLKHLAKTGVKLALAQILRNVDVVLVAANKERVDLEYDIGPLNSERTTCIRNGFHPSTAPLKTAGARDIDICVVGRIEARKNQISILEALDSLSLSGVFVGAENPNHRRYCSRFRGMIADSGSTYLGGRSQSEVYDIMSRSRVHVAASWFEVSSNVDIESYVLGCRTVASVCGATKELLGEHAYYVDPASKESIRRQILAAVASSQEGVQNPYSNGDVKLETWEEVSQSLLDVYLLVLGGGALDASSS